MTSYSICPYCGGQGCSACHGSVTEALRRETILKEAEEARKGLVEQVIRDNRHHRQLNEIVQFFNTSEEIKAALAYGIQYGKDSVRAKHDESAPSEDKRFEFLEIGNANDSERSD